MIRNKEVIDNQEVLIIDDFFDSDVCRNWVEYYIRKAEFKLAAFESADESCEGSQFFFTHGLSKSTLEDVFNMSQTVLPFVDEWNKNYGTDFQYTDVLRTHINLTQQSDTFSGHVDHHERDILIFLWFANPYLKDLGGGIELGEKDRRLIEPKFNRCVIFPGKLWHRIQDLTDPNSIRLSLYIGFDKVESKTKELSFAHDRIVNVFDKNADEILEQSKQVHKDFGIGN